MFTQAGCVATGAASWMEASERVEYHGIVSANPQDDVGRLAPGERVTSSQAAPVNEMDGIEHATESPQREWNATVRRAARVVFEKLLANSSAAALLLDGDLAPIGHTPRAFELCRRWSSGECEGDRPARVTLPAGVAAYCRALRAGWLRASATERAAAECDGICISPPHESLWRASISLLPVDGTEAGLPLFLVRFEEEGAAARRAEPFRRLTACEREVAWLVCQGCSNDEVARALGKSVLTVKKQLRAIYQKLNVPSRARLCALVRQDGA